MRPVGIYGDLWVKRDRRCRRRGWGSAQPKTRGVDAHRGARLQHCARAETRVSGEAPHQTPHTYAADPPPLLDGKGLFVVYGSVLQECEGGMTHGEALTGASEIRASMESRHDERGEV